MRTARFATSVIFLVHGLLVSAWVSRIPDVQLQLGLSEGVLGLALLGIAIGSLVSMPLAGMWITRAGSRTVTTWATYLFCAALALVPFGTSALALSLLLVCWGAAAGAMDVAMNAQGVSIQEAGQVSILSSMHALFSIGGMLGAFGGGQLARLGISVNVHLAGVAILCAVITFSVSHLMLPPDAEHDGSTVPHFSLPRGPVLTLGALGFCVLLCEGAMADWIAIFLRDWRAAGPATAAAGFAVFSGAMSIGRLAGDRITDRFGGETTVRAGAALATGGLALALVHESIAGALVGFIVVGLGFAAIVPNVFAASGRIPGVPRGAGIAAVTTMGYFGFLVGPPMIGWLAEWVGLRNALFTLVLLSAASVLLAGSLRRARSAATVPSSSGTPYPGSG